MLNHKTRQNIANNLENLNGRLGHIRIAIESDRQRISDIDVATMAHDLIHGQEYLNDAIHDLVNHIAEL